MASRYDLINIHIDYNLTTLDSHANAILAPLHLSSINMAATPARPADHPPNRATDMEDTQVPVRMGMRTNQDTKVHHRIRSEELFRGVCFR